jgi:hypothetical protein
VFIFVDKFKIKKEKFISMSQLPKPRALPVTHSLFTNTV